MAERVDKPKEPTGTPPDEVQPDTELTEKETDSSTEVRSDEFDEKFKNMESELGRLRQELGDERKRAEELNAYKLWYDQQSRQQVPQQPQPRPNYDEQWFDKPTETFETLAQQRESRMMYQQAFQAAPMAKTMARLQHPEAFEGITDAELDQAMYGGVQSGTTNPGILGDPNAWIGAAWILKGPKVNYRIPSAPPQNLEPVQTETPSRSSSGEEAEIPVIRGDALTDRLINEAEKMGITKEEFLKEVQATKEGAD